MTHKTKNLNNYQSRHHSICQNSLGAIKMRSWPNLRHRTTLRTILSPIKSYPHRNFKNSLTSRTRTIPGTSLIIRIKFQSASWVRSVFWVLRRKARTWQIHTITQFRSSFFNWRTIMEVKISSRIYKSNPFPISSSSKRACQHKWPWQEAPNNS